jgi:RHS repeat-associated protein
MPAIRLRLYSRSYSRPLSGRKNVKVLSQLQLPGLRYYSPRLGRWDDRDSLAEKGGANLYRMVANSPIDRLDTLGQFLGGVPVACVAAIACVPVAGLSCVGLCAWDGYWADPDEEFSDCMGLCLSAVLQEAPLFTTACIAALAVCGIELVFPPSPEPEPNCFWTLQSKQVPWWGPGTPSSETCQFGWDYCRYFCPSPPASPGEEGYFYSQLPGSLAVGPVCAPEKSLTHLTREPSGMSW